MKLPIAVLISGGGTTLKNLIQCHSAGKLDVDFRLVISSSEQAGGLAFASEASIPAVVLERKDFDSTDSYSRALFDHCRQAGVQLVVMGGFLKHVLVPDDFTNKVINIHPSLIPAFCGKGFYGRRVHQAALDYGAKLSGCTIHFVDNEYDHGPIISQHAVPVMLDDTAASLAARVFTTECEAYPQAIQAIAAGRVQVEGRTVRISR
ncbi:MAG: phosphoribosylglycinamide formyltransferase [Planctomycetales bacterium]|nr:phosphoribosylglycinamide formyltransferase [Planctomycetales bacterium]